MEGMKADLNVESKLFVTPFEKKPQLGDLIEISRGMYQHWGLYVGDGFIIHLAPPCELANAGAYSMMSVLSDKAVVKKEQLWDVAGTDKYTINNLLDKKYKPRSIDVILQEADRHLGRELPYCVVRGNCEHFVTELRYGQAESRQVQTAVEIGIAATVTVGIVTAVLAVIFGMDNKDKKHKQ